MHAPASRCHGTEAASLCTVSCWVCQQIRLTFNGFGGPAQGEKWPPTKNAAPGRGTPEGRAATLPSQHLWSEASPPGLPMSQSRSSPSGKAAGPDHSSAATPAKDANAGYACPLPQFYTFGLSVVLRPQNRRKTDGRPGAKRGATMRPRPIATPNRSADGREGEAVGFQRNRVAVPAFEPEGRSPAQPALRRTSRPSFFQAVDRALHGNALGASRTSVSS